MRFSTPLFGDSNLAAAYGAALVTIVVAVLSALLKFFESGQAWPTTVDGWVHLLLPALVAGVLAALTPYVQRQRAPTPEPPAPVPPAPAPPPAPAA